MDNLLLYETVSAPLSLAGSDDVCYKSDKSSLKPSTANNNKKKNNNTTIRTNRTTNGQHFITSNSEKNPGMSQSLHSIAKPKSANVYNNTWAMWELMVAMTLSAMVSTATAALTMHEDSGGGGGAGVAGGAAAIQESPNASLDDGAISYGTNGTDNTATFAPELNFFGGGGNDTTAAAAAAAVTDGVGNHLVQMLNASPNSSLDIFDTVTETPYVPYGMRPETYIVPVLFAFIFIVGVLGNGTLIVVFLSVRQMRNVPNTYILSLALADLLVIVTTVPLTSTVYTVDSWPWGSALCTLSEFFKDVSIGVSVFTLTALSGDRYFAIVDPLRKFHAHGGGKRATRMTIAIAVSIWLLAIVCGLPALLGTNVKIISINSNKSFALCYPFPEQWGEQYAKIMVMMRFLVYYAVPLIIIGVFYVLIARHLMYTASVPGEMQGAMRQVRARRKVAVTVLAFVVIFGICFLPYHVFMLWFYYWPTAQEDYNSFWHVLRIVGFCLSFANSCANPVALYFVSGAFRKHFNRYLFCQGSGVRLKKRHPHNDTLCMHRDTSLTSTVSKRYYNSRRSCHNQSTIRSRLQETTITMLPNGNNHNGYGNHGTVAAASIVTAAAIPSSTANQNLNDVNDDVVLTNDYCHYHRQHQQQQQLLHQQQQRAFM